MWTKHECIFLSTIGLITGGFILYTIIKDWYNLALINQVGWSFVGIGLIILFRILLVKNLIKLYKEDG